MYNVWEKVLLPSKRKTFVWHLCNLGPTSSTLVQHCIKSYKCFVFTGWQYIQAWESSSFQIPAVIQSVCLQVGDQVGQKTRALNYYLIDVAQVYMNLLWFENLLLMRLWVWNAYLVLLWNRALAYPRALLPSGGPLSREFWQLTTPLIFVQRQHGQCLVFVCCGNQCHFTF